MSMFDQFETSEQLEKNGIKIDYGSFRVTIARAGGANKRYEKILDVETKPYRRAIMAETFDNARSEQILMKVFAKAVVLNWEVNENYGTGEDPKWKKGIESPDGSVITYSEKNVIATFKLLPDLFRAIREDAEKASLFQAEARKEEAKN